MHIVTHFCNSDLYSSSMLNKILRAKGCFSLFNFWENNAFMFEQSDEKPWVQWTYHHCYFNLYYALWNKMNMHAKKCLAKERALSQTENQNAHMSSLMENLSFPSLWEQILRRGDPCYKTPMPHRVSAMLLNLPASQSREGKTRWKPCRSVMWNLCRNSGRILLGY